MGGHRSARKLGEQPKPFHTETCNCISANMQASMAAAAAAAAHLAAQQADALPQRLQHIVKRLDAVWGCTEQGQGKAACSLKLLLEACGRVAPLTRLRAQPRGGYTTMRNNG